MANQMNVGAQHPQQGVRAARPAAALETALEDLSKSIGLLADRTAELAHRLEPALLPLPARPSGAATAVDEPAASQYVLTVRRLQWRVEALLESLSEIDARLEA